ncbi:thiol reductant ABC exporter subunit CydD [Saccharibacter sp. 17.LH.SD]|uniref:thiol reductant ABC exporter subunit CydD n=1 Tax=Saccharibacter sp. 17.LH.SD TaxID=2689393 RepID=UPI00136EEDFA|nr:thiol reductant ABC exporter subunit CydD [Saccharibacter sp. 17.LH.SD]MXV45036.1 thiol reductant ABC exporter subunit CydD [Saccharibacter sp. 17.LH.SD]
MAECLRAHPRPTLSGLTNRASLPLALSVTLGGIGATLLIGQMYLLATIVTDIAFRHHTLYQEKTLALLLLLAVMLRALCQAGADSCGDLAGQKATASLRLEVIEHLFQVGPVGLSHQNSGHIATTLSEGIDALQPYIARYMPRAAAMVVTPLLIMAVVLKLDIWSFLILAVTGPLIPLFMALVGYGAQSIMDRKWTELLLLGASFLDMLQGITTLRLFGRSRDSVTLVAHMAHQHRQSTMAVMRVAFLTSAVLEFFSSLSIALVAVAFGARLLNASFAFQDAFIVLLLAPEFFMPLRNFSASYHARQNATSAFKPIIALLKLPALRDLPPTTRPSPLPNIFTLEINDLRAGYGKDEDTLKGVSATFRPNELTVITGASGSGKSTLLRLLLGMMPPRQGSLSLRLTNGRTHTIQDAPIGWVPQRPFILADSISANLRLGAPDASDELLQQILEEVGLWNTITALPNSLQTILGENGAPFSAGQIRRLALARALLGHPQILLFDEPTSDLDEENARLVASCLARTVHTGRISLAITHRHDLLEQAHHILHLSQGRLAPMERSAA